MATTSGVPYVPTLDPDTVLHAVPFTVIDLETTGGSPGTCRITEVGAVRIQGGEVVGELATLVDPGQSIPAAITALTGISPAMVAGHPPIEAVLPTLLEFCQGSVLIAHNARFDVGFLNRALERLDYPPLRQPVVCTAALARRLVGDDVRNCQLATLARHFRTRTQPIHRALADARATVEVFHCLLEQVGSYGVTTLGDLQAFSKVRDAPVFRARRELTDGLPSKPGVYAFRSRSGEVLYVGKASDLRSRVRTYFGSDQRRMVTRLLWETARVDHRVCPTTIEAEVRELRAIHAHLPRYNRRSKPAAHPVWLKLTVERFPRLSVVRAVRDDGAAYLGPLRSQRVAEQVRGAVHDALAIRPCRIRIGTRTRMTPCVLGEIGRCRAPCTGVLSPAGYADVTEQARAALGADPSPVIEALTARMRRLAREQRFEEAGSCRDRLRAFVLAVSRARRAETLRGVTLAVTHAGTRQDRVDVVVMSDGLLVGSDRCRPGHAGAVAARISARAAAGPQRSAWSAEAERDLLARWLANTPVAPLWVDGTYATRLTGGQALGDAEHVLAGSGWR